MPTPVATPVPIQSLTGDVKVLVNTGILNQRQANTLLAKLEAAYQKINTGNVTATINQLQAFINQVNADIGPGKHTLAQGQPLIDAANAIIAALGS